MSPLPLLLLLAAAPLQAGMSPVAETQLDEGLRHLYNLDYEKSRAAFRRLIEIDPEDPAGYLFEAGAIWWQSDMERGLFKSTPTLQGLFEQDVEAAIRKADKLQAGKDREKRADGYFVEGMALGTRGQWEMLRGHWVQAYFDGKKAVKNLKKTLRLDGEYHDAYFGLGIFDYQVSRFSGLLKGIGALIGMRGDEERGLDRMRLASLSGRYTKRQAAQFLLSIYLFDKRDWAGALPLAERLRGDFPESPYFQLVETVLRFRLGDWDGSLVQGRKLFDRLASDPKAFDRKLMSLACGLSGDKCLAAEDVERALAWLDRALASAAREKPGPWQTFLHLYRGYALDILGRPQEAGREYQKVLAHPDLLGCRARARECLKAPCDADALKRYFLALSKGEPWPPRP